MTDALMMMLESTTEQQVTNVDFTLRKTSHRDFLFVKQFWQPNGDIRSTHSLSVSLQMQRLHFLMHQKPTPDDQKLVEVGAVSMVDAQTMMPETTTERQVTQFDLTFAHARYHLQSDAK